LNPVDEKMSCRTKIYSRSRFGTENQSRAARANLASDETQKYSRQNRKQPYPAQKRLGRPVRLIILNDTVHALNLNNCNARHEHGGMPPMRPRRFQLRHTTLEPARQALLFLKNWGLLFVLKDDTVSFLLKI